MNEGHETRKIGRIPVNNLWFLMLYASDLLRFGSEPALRLYDKDVDDVAQLIAALLAKAAEQRLRRSPTQSYIRRHRNLSRVRGRIDVLETSTRSLLSKGLVACRLNELSADTPRNRLLRVALERMGRLAMGEVADRCRSYARLLARMDVSGILPTRADLSRDTISRNDAHDRQIMGLARLAFDLALPTEEIGLTRSYAPMRDEVWVRRLFERAIRGFCSFEFRERRWSVSGGDHLYWQLMGESPAFRSLLPRMETDVIIDAGENGRLVIDTKFTSILADGRYGNQTFKSAHMYQLYAYLRSQEGLEPFWQHASGMLLYPSIGDTVVEQGRIQGHKVTFATVDLRQPPSRIRAELVELIPNAVGL